MKLGRIKAFSRQLLDQLIRQPLFGLAVRNVVSQLHVLVVPHLVLVVHMVQDQPLPVGPQQPQLHLAAGPIATHRNLAGATHGLRQEPKSLLATLVGAQVLAPVDVHEVDRCLRYELHDVQGLEPFGLQCRHLVGAELDELVLRDLETLDDVLALDELVVHRALQLLLERRPTLAVQLLEAHAL